VDVPLCGFDEFKIVDLYILDLKYKYKKETSFGERHIFPPKKHD
jgi:hypothetical protein